MVNLGKGFYWTLLVTVFSLTQLWVNLAYLTYTQTEAVTFYRLTSDGLLLFFALAVTMSVTMDFWFDARTRSYHLWQATAFAFYPIGVTGVVIAAYLMIAAHPDVVREDWVNGLNFGAVFLTLLYAIVGKTYLFQQTSNTTID